MNKNVIIVFLSMMVIILILSAIIIFRKPQVIIQKQDSGLRDSIAILTEEINHERKKTARMIEYADSILSLPPKIKIIYDTQRVFTNNANLSQLDSIIRANAGL